MKKINLSLFILFSLLSGSLFAQTAAPITQPTLIEKVTATPGSLNIPYEKWKLPNGLTILVHEDHSDPVVNVRITYHVGSARESLGKSGFAHFFEHMMFEGSDNVKDKEHFKIISESGGDMNGNTERDVTNYFETVPSNYLETALWLEADRMGFLLDSVTKEKFEIQRSTVKNEKGQNVENQPYALAYVEVINQILYPYGHPYSWPVIGYTDDLDRVTVDDLKNFFLRWYGPNNAVLVVAGDVNTKDVIALADKYFGPIPSCPEVKKLRASAPPLTSDKYSNYIDNIYLPMTLMVYPTVPAFHKDEPAIDLLAAMIGQGNNSVFYKNFNKAEKGFASVSQSNDELAGELQIQVLTYPDFEIPQSEYPANPTEAWIKKKTQEIILKSFNETEKQIHEAIDEFEKTGMTDSALQRVKARREAAIIQSGSTVFEKAALLARVQTLVNKPYNLQDELDRYNKITLEDITRVFNKYVKDKHVAIVNVFPKEQNSTDSAKSFNPSANITLKEDPEYAGLKYVKAKDNFDRSKHPVPGPSKQPEVPQYYTQQLKNGINIIGTKEAESPSVLLLFELKGGDYVNAGDLKKAGLAELTAGLMNEGTKNYSTERISAELEKLGSSISFSATKSSTSIYVNSLTKNLDATLALLEEKLLRPGFNAEDFMRVKKELIQSMTQEKKSANSVARNLYNNLIYGNNFMGAYAVEKNVKKFTIDDVKEYYAKYYSPSAAKIVVVGDISETDLVKKLDFLNKWQGKEVKMPEMPAFPAIEKTQIYVADQQGAVQSVIMVGKPGLPFDATGEFFKANVMNFPLGGSFNSRLNLNLRENKGFTYGIYSGFSGSKYPGTFTITASVRRNATDTAITEIMKEIKNFRNDGLKDDEVTFTKNSILNSEALRYEGTYAKAGFLSQISEYNLPRDYATRQMEIMKGMTKQELNDLAKKHLDADRMVILVVGNRYLIKDKLEKLGFGKINDVKLD